MSDEIRDVIMTTEDALYQKYDPETAQRLHDIQQVYDPALGALVMIRERRSEFDEYVGLHTTAALTSLDAEILKTLDRLDEEAEQILDDTTEADQ